jgi:hypothetical protein
MALKFTKGILSGDRIMQFRKDADGNVVPFTERFSFADSAYIEDLKKTNPGKYRQFKRALKYADEHEITQSTFTTASGLYENANKSGGGLGVRDAARHGEYLTAAQRGAVEAVNLFATFDHHAQASSRQIFFLSAFELAYDRETKKGASPIDAGEAAITLAEKLTDKLMFQYAESSKSLLLRNPVGRLPFFLFQYGLQLTSLLGGNLVKMVSLQTNRNERLGAAKMFLGSTMSLAAAGGFATPFLWPMFTIGYSLFQFVSSLADDEGEDDEPLAQEEFIKEFRRYADENGHELAKRSNMELYARMHYIPETFGPGGTIAGALGLSDEAAMTMQKLVEQGVAGAFFDVDITDSMRVDQTWSPAEIRSNNPETQFLELFGGTYMGAMLRGASTPFRFYDELSRGETGRALETISPKWVKDPLKAMRLQEEGVVTGADRNIQQRGPEEFSGYNTLMQTLGFLEADSRRESRLRIMSSELTRELQQERSDLLDRRFEAIQALMGDPSEENMQEMRRVNRAVDIFRANYPSSGLTDKALEASFTEKARYIRERSGGQYFDPRFPVELPLAQERAREQQMAREQE